MEKLNLTPGPSSGDSGPVGGKKLNDNFKELVRVLFGVDIWETSSVADVSSYLQQLPTNNNTSILSALSEIYVKDDIIDDDGSDSVLKTWSITKLKEYFSNKTELQNALNLKLEKGNYTGNAQDLKDLIDSLQGLATTNQENISTNENDISDLVNTLIDKLNKTDFNLPIADENGIDLFNVDLNAGEKLQFKGNYIANGAEKTIEIPTVPVQGYATLILGGLGNTITTPAQVLNLFQQYNGEEPIVEKVGVDSYIVLSEFFTFKNSAFQDNLLLNFIEENAGHLTQYSTDLFNGCTNLTIVNTKTAKNAGRRTFRGCTSLNFSLSSLDSLFLGNASISCFENIVRNGDTLTLKGVTSITDQLAFSQGEYTLNLPNLKSAGIYRGFANFKGMLNAPNLDDLGDVTNNQGIFLGVTSDTVLNVNYKLKTANNGQPHEALIHAISLGATVNYVNYSELFDEIAKLNLRQYADDTSASAGNIGIGEPYVNSMTGAIHLRQI